MEEELSTVTSRVAAIQVTMLHLQFRMKKIYEDQRLLNSKLPEFKTNREVIKGMSNAAYNSIDMLITMDHLHDIISDIFATPELRDKFDDEMYKVLNRTKKIAQRWKPVRNKLGGHIDIDIVEDICEEHNYKGVFISDDLEADMGVLNMLLIESAVNTARKTSDIFKRDLDLKHNGLAQEMKLFVDTLNQDWNTAFQYFEPMMEFMYKIGKKEKMESSNPNDWKGIVVD